jgi:hypothetical protein
MKNMLLRLLTAILAFSFGVVVDRVLVSREVWDLPPPQLAERCDPSRIEVKTVFVPPPAAPLQQVQAFDFDIDFEPPNGTFDIAGKKPKGFQDFGYLELWWQQGAEVGEIAGEVTLYTLTNNLYQDQRTVVAVVTERRVFLITESKSEKGFGYRFDGEFIQHKNLQALAEAGKPIIRGTLTKTLKGKTIAEIVVSLYLDNSDHC